MKNKNNILIIAIVTLFALTVIGIVLLTGFVGGKGLGENASSVPEEISVSVPDESDLEPSKPQNTSDFETSVSESETSDSSESVTDSSEPETDDIGSRISLAASALIGTPFAENGESPSGFDNSGFIYYVLRENGYITCPRTTQSQAQMGTRVGRDSLNQGDLVFFGENGEAQFGGIYIGNGKMIAALSVGAAVREVDITSDYYASGFAFGISLS